MITILPDGEAHLSDPATPLDRVIHVLLNTVWKRDVNSSHSPTLEVFCVDADSINRYMSKILDNLTSTSDYPPIPFFIVFRGEPSSRSLGASEGLDIPQELILTLDERLEWLNELPRRLTFLRQVWPSGFSLRDCHDMFIGNYRKAIGLGCDHHDSGVTITKEIEGLKGDFKIARDHPTWSNGEKNIVCRLQKTHPYYRQSLFPIEHAKLEATASRTVQYAQGNDEGQTIQSASEFERTLKSLRHYGFSIKHTGPLPLSLNSIDDNDIAESTRTDKVGRDSSLPCELHTLINLDTRRFWKVDPNEMNLIEVIARQLDLPITINDRSEKRFSLLSCDFLLLDLSLKNEVDSADPLGFSVLNKIQQRFPYLPVLIFSAYGQSKHIVRAIQNGAQWFCNKSEAYKLPNYLLNLLENRPWEHYVEAIRCSSPTFVATLKAVNAINDPRIDRNQTDSCEIASAIYDLFISKVAPTETELNVVPPDVLTSAGGATTLRVRNGAPTVSPVIIKHNLWDSVQGEAIRYRRFIHPYIANNCGRIDSAPVRTGRHHGALLYSYAGHSRGINDKVVAITATPLKLLMCEQMKEGMNFSHIRPVFNVLFQDILPPLHSTSPDSTWPDLQFGEFTRISDTLEVRLPSHKTIEIKNIHPQSETIRGDWALLVEHDSKEFDCLIPVPEGTTTFRRIKLTGPIIEGHAKHRHIRPFIPLIYEISSLVVDRDRTLSELFGPDISIQSDVERLLELVQGDLRHNTALIGIVHGDLNLGNIMVDSQDSHIISPMPWLIDFARTRRDHIVHDFAILECDLLTELAPIANIQPDQVKSLLDDCDRAILSQALLKGNPQAMYLVDAVRVVREVAGARGVDKTVYLATLTLYLIAKVKILKKSKNAGHSFSLAVTLASLLAKQLLTHNDRT